MRSLIDMAADRGAFIDQSQSLNLFAESPNIGRLSSMYMYAWKRGIKTTYYLRSRPATKIAKTTVAVATREPLQRHIRAQPSPARSKTQSPAKPASSTPFSQPPISNGELTMSSNMSSNSPTSILDPGLSLTLRPMQYPGLLRDVQRRHPQHLDRRRGRFLDRPGRSQAHVSLRLKIHLIQRLVAFFATGDSIVSNNLVLNLYKHINSPEARLYLSRQLFEEAVHVQFYLTLLDNYVPDPDARAAAFAAVENIPTITKKAQFCMKWMDSIQKLDELRTPAEQKQFLLNLICFAGCIEGLFFFAAFAYVYFLRSRGLLNGLAGGTNWVFRDESCHLEFAFEVVNVVRSQHPELFDAEPRIRHRRDDEGGGGMRAAVRRRPALRRRRRSLGARDAPVPRVRRRLPRRRVSAWSPSSDRRIPFPSWNCRTYRNWPTSSSAESPPTR